ncbi:MAG: hypothetical protein IT479_08990 [Xanthomonadales bacterium]|nr:hypothetical protein [Xanthomonadales bacterium]
MKPPFIALLIIAAIAGTMTVPALRAAEEEHAVERHYVKAPDAPRMQTKAQAAAKSDGCVSCHNPIDQVSMHASPSVILGCTDCHGGDATVMGPKGADDHVAQAPGHGNPGEHAADDHGDGHEHGAHKYAPDYFSAMERAHVLPRYPGAWHYPSSANPERSYALLNREAPEFTRFVNPSDLRVADEACGACHQPIIEAAKRSIMATSAMLWGGAAYNNGILPFKRYILGEGYQRDGAAAIIKALEPVTPQAAVKGALEQLVPMPAWEVIPPGDIFRVFERGGRNINTTFPETGLPNSLGQIQRLEEPGRPDFRQSNRGPGTGQRIAVPVINILKTRLNDPNMWFMGTNDQPGDFRNSGCAACHVPYANDRDPRHSGKYAQFGHMGGSQQADPTIPKGQPGHPLKHAFTRSIPTAQCMNCHMHPPHMFSNTFLGYIMWDYESDAPSMWPEQQKYPSHAEARKALDRNPEEAVIRGKWSDLEFVKEVSALNPKLKDTQFADYHGHGWNFRAIFKRDRVGNLLDAEGNKVSDDDPKKFEKAVHMSSIHVDLGMHCVDCHFAQDMHGNGHIVGEVMAGVEIQCKDCHGTPDQYPNLITSGPMASKQGRDLSTLRNPDGKRRFEWIAGKLIQRSIMESGLQWEMTLVKDVSDPASAHYNAKADRAHTMRADPKKQDFGKDVPPTEYAHGEDKMLCYSCHTSWTTSCGGCHLPIQANWKTDRKHYEGGFTRNYATYNPQVARDDVFMLARHGEIKDFKYAPMRSSSALVLSSTNSNRERIYIQQPPIAASGYSSQARAPHYPHTERRTETKTCTDCHLSEEGDNNAIMAQLLGHGTKFMDLLGFNAWVGGEGEINAVQVTEWEEPQAVIGSYLHRYAYPDWYRNHEGHGRQLQHAAQHDAGVANCIQLRGEYVYVAEGSKGMRVYDAASIANKGVSQKIVTAPFSPLGHDTHVATKNATCVVLATTQPVQPSRNQGDLMRKTNLEQPAHPIYRYAFISDAEEGLILVDIDTLLDGEPRNNFLERALTWNENGVLDGARHLTIAGYWFYFATPKGIVIVDMNDPMKPRYVRTVPMQDPRGSQQQFRYLFVTTARGLEVLDITHPGQATPVDGALVPIRDAHKLHVARTYAYVAAGVEGLVIVDVTRPTAPKLYQRFNGDGAIGDSRDVTVASTNASLYAYVADGRNGLHVVQLTGPDIQPKFYGYSPEPKPKLIASYKTGKPALSLSRALERDRAVDETGGQVAILGRVGARPLNETEQKAFYLDDDGQPWFVTDRVEGPRGITSPVLPWKNNRTLEQQRAEAKATDATARPAGSH